MWLRQHVVVRVVHVVAVASFQQSPPQKLLPDILGMLFKKVIIPIPLQKTTHL
jgi:hypothetical protein